ncbi:MAG: four helix bundle protein [Bacteroidetes bacterium]|nr:four helix bundle protein [Bacteroidota bacterium]
MTPDELKNRTMQLGIDIIFLCEKLPAKAAGRAVENQIVRSATSVGCNYRAALRGRSKPDFINKIGVVLEELDETQYWIEVAVKAKLLEKQNVAAIWKEAEELMKILTRTSITAKENLKKKK